MRFDLLIKGGEIVDPATGYSVQATSRCGVTASPQWRATFRRRRHFV
jgi:hypothetical protein